jgi:hypothetical protein
MSKYNYGIMDDIYITETPVITYFKVKYKRHTDFVREIMALDIPPQPKTQTETDMDAIIRLLESLTLDDIKID